MLRVQFGKNCGSNYWNGKRKNNYPKSTFMWKHLIVKKTITSLKEWGVLIRSVPRYYTFYVLQQMLHSKVPRNFFYQEGDLKITKIFFFQNHNFFFLTPPPRPQSPPSASRGRGRGRRKGREGKRNGKGKRKEEGISCRLSVW